MKKKITSLLLALALCPGLLPAVALAEEDCTPNIVIGGSHGERPPTDPYKDHIDDLAEAAEKGYVLSFSDGEDGPIDLGSAEYGYTTPPAKTITMTNKGDKSLYLISTGVYAVVVTIEGDEYKKQSNLNFDIPVYELEPGHTYHLNIEALPNMDAKTHRASFSLDFSYTYPANHSALKAWDLSCDFEVTYTITYDGDMGGDVPITVSQESLDFTAVECGTTQEQTFTVTNTSDWKVDLRGYGLASFLRINGNKTLSTTTLAPGESVTLTIAATPKEAWSYSHDEELELEWLYRVEGGGNWQSHNGKIKIPIHVQTTKDGKISVSLGLESPAGPSGYFTSMDGAATYWGNERFDIPVGESLSLKAVPFDKEHGYVLAVAKRRGNSDADGYDYIGHDDVITFENVSGEQRIKVAIASGQKPPADWARDAIGRAYTLGLFHPNGMPGFHGGGGVDTELPGSSFDDPISRADFCKLAAQLYKTVVDYHENPFSGANASSIELPTFTDTSSREVREMAYLGVVTGVGAETFDPDGQLTREQAAAILSRLAGVLGIDLDKAAPTFDDNGSISPWASEAVGEMQAAGIMSGLGNNQFGPQGPYSWEQSIATLMRIYDMTL